MGDPISVVDVAVLTEIINALNKLDPDARQRTLQSVATLFGLSLVNPKIDAPFLAPSSDIGTPSLDQRTSFTEDRSLSPKDFVWQKQPRTAIERVVCLAYYLVHYRGVPQFRTSDITNLNMEAAQIRFSNPGMMVAEATRRGYLVSAAGQAKQLSVIGEQFVRLLPDRKAALDAIANAKPRRSRKKSQKEDQST